LVEQSNKSVEPARIEKFVLGGKTEIGEGKSHGQKNNGTEGVRVPRGLGCGQYCQKKNRETQVDVKKKKRQGKGDEKKKGVLKLR